MSPFIRSCGRPACPVCGLSSLSSRSALDTSGRLHDGALAILAAGILWHLAATGEPLEALSSTGRLIVQADALRRRLERRPDQNYAACRILL